MAELKLTLEECATESALVIAVDANVGANAPTVDADALVTVLLSNFPLSGGVNDTKSLSICS